MTRRFGISRRRFVSALAACSLGAPALSDDRDGRWSVRRRPRVAGRLVARGDTNYEEWRRGMPWQMRKPARYPDLIVQARDSADVVASVNFARRNGLKLAVKSGGHHVWANFLRDGGLLLDLSRLRSVEIDAERRTALAGPAIWGRNLIQRTLPLGLGFPVAHCATVPLGGFLLGGGFGLNGDEWGTMSALAVRSAEVVTASGDLLQVSATQNPDLYWALRGAGNGFPGVVTRFELQLFEAPPTVLASTYIFPASRIGEVAALGAQLARAAPRHTEILGIVAIDGQNPAADNQVMCVLRVASFAPNADEARSILEPIAANPLAAAAIMKFESAASDWESMFLDSIDASRGFGFGRYAVDSIWTREPAGVMSLLADRLAASPSQHSHAVIQFKVRTELPQDAALSRIAPAFAGVYSVWRDEAIDSAAQRWLRETMTPLEQYADGHYINEIDAEARPQRIEASFSNSAWRRLAELRHARDPGAVFHDFFGRHERGLGAST